MYLPVPLSYDDFAVGGVKRHVRLGFKFVSFQARLPREVDDHWSREVAPERALCINKWPGKIGRQVPTDICIGAPPLAI